MFCYQCQETARNVACTVRGVCGKEETLANLQDLLVYVCKGIGYLCQRSSLDEENLKKVGRFLQRALFVTLTNVGWDESSVIDYIKEGLKLKEELVKSANLKGELPDCVSWGSYSDSEIKSKASSPEVRLNFHPNEDITSLRSIILYGLKGIGAYSEHASVLGYEDIEIYRFMTAALSSTVDDLSEEDLLSVVLKTGEFAVKTLALLDKANTETFGEPEIVSVKTSVRDNPGILVSGHDLKDLEELLEQTKGTGIDVYTHGEMLPAHAYPKFRKYTHLVGNYGGSWPNQNEEFESFNGPILLTTNCLTPLRKENTYLGRLFTTGPVSYPSAIHIPDRKDGKPKDFSQIIEVAKKSKPPKNLESGTLTIGFARNQLLKLKDKILDAVNSGSIKRLIVMAGCDGRHKTREYYTQVAKSLPRDTVILTAGCAKYRYNKLNLGDIDGIPRVIDAGQCNDSYSLAFIALKLKEILGLDDINKLPISLDIAWYEQKAVSVLLALLYLGFKGFRLGPTFPAFLSQRVGAKIIEMFKIKGIESPEKDVEQMLKGM